MAHLLRSPYKSEDERAADVVAMVVRDIATTKRLVNLYSSFSRPLGISLHPKLLPKSSYSPL